MYSGPESSRFERRPLSKNADTAAPSEQDTALAITPGVRALSNIPPHYSANLEIPSRLPPTSQSSHASRYMPALSCLPSSARLDRELTSEGQRNQTSTFAASMIRDRLIHLYFRARLSRVRSSVASYGGTISFKFAQTKGTFLEQIMKHVETSGGTCEALSAHWIARHADGQSLFDRLYTNGRKGQFRIDELYSVKQLQIAGLANDVDQDRVTESWLREHGVKRHGLRRRGRTGAEGTGRLLDAMLDTAGRQDGYKSIELSGAHGSHGMAAYVHKDEGIIFFDPNFGEFRFPDAHKFRRWFTDAFWDRSGYRHQTFGLGREFVVLNFESHP
ncbi:cysteine protease [Trinickia symbiotica]|uniref:Cysteine protease n=1 Tax=Trinickia symbiotica TaxID=863227 RepID=A0A2T3XYA8_9BURK|nr:YopT-type cysteine protease domain-containing protein [Trinickia symbiotica]PTB21498.1 cysteine protease [Trinickia symbiotica]